MASTIVAKNSKTKYLWNVRKGENESYMKVQTLIPVYCSNTMKESNENEIKQSWLSARKVYPLHADLKKTGQNLSKFFSKKFSQPYLHLTWKGIRMSINLLMISQVVLKIYCFALWFLFQLSYTTKNYNRGVEL